MMGLPFVGWVFQLMAFMASVFVMSRAAVLVKGIARVIM